MKRSTVTRRLLSLALGMALALTTSLTLPARAAGVGGPYAQITISSNNYVSTPDDDAAKTDPYLKDKLTTRFWAYQIFSGTINEAEFKEEYEGNWDANRLSDIEWGASIQENKQEQLLTALSEDKTPARELGITFALMRQAGERYLDATNLDNYTAAYRNAGNWLEGKIGDELTMAGRAALEATFNTDLEKLTIGDVFTAALNKNVEAGTITQGAYTASQVIIDFTPSTGNFALGQAFYAIVFDKEPASSTEEAVYKYLNNDGNEDGYGGAYAVSDWVSGTGWTIGKWDGSSIDSCTLDPGYYMIRDVYEEKDNEGKASASFMAGVYGYGIIEPKAEAPEVKKTISNTSYSGASRELGETIIFTLKGTLPKNYFTAYKGYPYIFEDTMAEGLTYGSITRVYVKVFNSSGKFGTQGAKFDYYLVDEYTGEESGNQGKGYRFSREKTSNGGTQITVSFPNLQRVNGRRASQSFWNTDNWYKDADSPQVIPIANDSEVYVEYTATLNEGANITDPHTGNPNTVVLRYANEPLWDPAAVVNGGTWDNAWRDAPTGQVTAFVRAYDFGIQLLVKGVPNDEDPDPVETDAPQTDAGETKKPEPLSGAGFALRKGTDENVQYAILHKNKTPDFKGNDPQGRAEYTYYLAGWVSEDDLYTYLAGGDTLTRTTRSWSEALDAGAEIGGITVSAEGEYYASVVTEEDGLVRVVGLNGGSTYYLEEVITPTGYDAVDDISIWFSAAYAAGGVLNELTADVNGADAEGDILSANKFQGIYDTTYQELVARLTVEQEPAGEIVDTGGMGTTLFYIGGGALLAGAALLLIFSGVKKRSGKHTR